MNESEYDKGYRIGYQQGLFKGLFDGKEKAVKHGEWIIEGGYCYKIGMCSVCGIGTDEYKEFAYCPKCGARMDGERNGG